MGLRENLDKMKVVTRQPGRQAELVQLGLPVSALSTRARVLGFDFCAKWNDPERPTAAARRAEALLIAKGCLDSR